ncbi:MAG: RNA polymerase sigma factor [Gemmatimonadetes bacterium]|nr:RNA polymerase sigma factor [Gemmatimonadota bacterium]MBT5056706.1 RNA polymerase sigma factor [Gemmatimonadota bacterium]MBT5145653.1 RNA polymerase sigma factor [Gemmatimonadota bacterium]MBT5588117.1 RNA polymerase sigma factor [Gemmatimonadota bacterium]MBT5960717.1 RNA polymerase sigma factor [Gemmatimonadota bacterium]
MRELIQAGYGYALSLTHATGDAEDLVHEAWLRLARRGQHAPDRALLFTTIRHLYIDLWRRQDRHPTVEIEDESHTAITQSEDQQLDHVDLTRALKGLRVEEREAIYLQAIQGYSAAEVADLMAMPRGSVLSLIHRGKARLRKILCIQEEETPDGP